MNCRQTHRVAAWLVLASVLACLAAPATSTPLARAEAEPTVQVKPVGGAGEPSLQENLVPTTNLLEIMRKGGVLMYPIAACSVIMLAFVLERAISLRHGRVVPKPFVTRFLEQMREGALDRETALNLCEENGSPVSEVFAGAVRKWGRPAVEVEQAIIDSGERVTNGLRRYLRVFNGVTTVTPLLGLLGTVFGMIQAFNALAMPDPSGRARPQLLAEGIANALLTTAFGLAVAIPALILYLYFVSRVDRLIIEIDALGEQLVPLICAEEMGNRPPKAVAKSRRAGRQESGVQ